MRAAAAVAAARSSSGTDGSLTWAVPPPLERDFGPASAAEAEAGSAAAAPAAADAAADADTPLAAGDQTAADSGVSSVHAPQHSAAVTVAAAHDEAAAPAQGSSVARHADPDKRKVTPGCTLSPSSVQPSAASGVHPLVLLYRQEIAGAADEHLSLMLWQLLRAEEVEDAESWHGTLLQLTCQAARCLLPAAAAAFGQQDPRYYIKVCLLVCLSVCLPACLSAYLPACLPTWWQWLLSCSSTTPVARTHRPHPYQAHTGASLSCIIQLFKRRCNTFTRRSSASLGWASRRTAVSCVA
jgi:hypothetical protein